MTDKPDGEPVFVRRIWIDKLEHEAEKHKIATWVLLDRILQDHWYNLEEKQK